MLSRHVPESEAHCDVSLVLPMFNPGFRLHQTLQSLSDFVERTSHRWELVFVCDGCTDGSANQIAEWMRGRQNIRLVSYSPNRGKGYAVRRGLMAAHARYRIFTDIDLAYPFKDIQVVAWRLRGGDDVVIGSRTHSESTIELPPSALGYAWRRQKQSEVFGRVMRMILSLTQRDTQAGLKGFSDRAVSMIMPYLQCDGFGFDCEILSVCNQLGLRVTEVPVHVRCDASGSTTGLGSVLRMIGELWRIRKGLRTPGVVTTSLPIREAA